MLPASTTSRLRALIVLLVALVAFIAPGEALARHHATRHQVVKAHKHARHAARKAARKAARRHARAARQHRTAGVNDGAATVTAA